MKKLILILIAVSAFSCKKSTEQSDYQLPLIVKRDFIPVPLQDVPAQSRTTNTTVSYTLARAETNLPIQGVQTTMDAVNLGNESGRSTWCSIFIGDTWMQIGYRNRAIHVLEYYYDDVLDSLTIVNPSPPIYYNAKNTFFIHNVNGTNWWVAGRNGQVIIKWKAKTNVGRKPSTGIEYYASNAKFPKLNFYPALEIYSNGSWTAPTSSWCSYRGRWGVEGPIQKPTLRYNELNMGGDVPLYPGLWQLF